MAEASATPANPPLSKLNQDYNLEAMTLHQKRMKAVYNSIKALHRFCKPPSSYQQCVSCTALLPLEVDMRRHRGLCKEKKTWWTPEELEDTCCWQGFEDSCVWFNLAYLWGPEPDAFTSLTN